MHNQKTFYLPLWKEPVETFDKVDSKEGGLRKDGEEKKGTRIEIKIGS